MNSVHDNNSYFIGESEAAESIRALAKQVAASDISVLITGESGTGKEVVARMIHRLSPRSSKPLVTVNCGAIPEGIFESEVFGHERGSFTGADKQRKGYFETADGGAILLDEIGEMPLNSQVKILRILETGQFMRVGGSSDIRVDVRVIAATNRDIAEATARGQFRSDLYFRLKAVNIFIPPLRERRKDIPVLASHFAQDFCRRNSIEAPRITAEAMELLTNAYWEGNVRELKNFIESVVTLERGSAIGREQITRLLTPQPQTSYHLPVVSRRPQGVIDVEFIYGALFELNREVREVKEMLGELLNRESHLEVSSASLDDMEREQIFRTLDEYSGNRRMTAKALGIGERTLYRKLKQYGLS